MVLEGLTLVLEGWVLVLEGLVLVLEGLPLVPKGLSISSLNIFLVKCQIRDVSKRNSTGGEKPTKTWWFHRVQTQGEGLYSVCLFRNFGGMAAEHRMERLPEADKYSFDVLIKRTKMKKKLMEDIKSVEEKLLSDE